MNEERNTIIESTSSLLCCASHVLEEGERQRTGTCGLLWPPASPNGIVHHRYIMQRFSYNVQALIQYRPLGGSMRDLYECCEEWLYRWGKSRRHSDVTTSRNSTFVCSSHRLHQCTLEEETCSTTILTRLNIQVCALSLPRFLASRGLLIQRSLKAQIRYVRRRRRLQL